jgi:hypothetical protein
MEAPARDRMSEGRMNIGAECSRIVLRTIQCLFLPLRMIFVTVSIL